LKLIKWLFIGNVDLSVDWVENA